MQIKTPIKRYNHTLEFLQNVLPAPATILDLGVRNPFTEIMEKMVIPFTIQKVKT